jgi:hypothetical protein
VGSFFDLLYIYKLNILKKHNMKKIYISILATVISIVSIAQVATQANNNLNFSKSFNQPLNSNTNSVSPIMNAFWESDFSDPSDWVVDNTGSITNEGWSIDPTVDSWYLPAFSSTGGGNFAEVGNGDPNAAGWNGPVGVEYTLTMASPVNIYDSIGSGNATLSFEEFGARFLDLQSIQVSTDGATFTTIGDNLNYAVTSQTSGSNPYPNPSLREINLAPYIGATPSTVWIRFSWTTNFPTQSTDPNVFTTYGWCIDNVKISESPSNKITMTDPVTGGYWIDYLMYNGTGINGIIGLDYSITPLSQLANHPFAIEALFVNEGTASQTVSLKYDVTGSSTVSGSSAPEVINPNDSSFLGASFNPSTVGSYSINIYGVADSAGAGLTSTQSTVETKDVEVSNYIYAKDLGLPTTSATILGGPTDQWEKTTRYEMYANEILYSIRVYIGIQSFPGAKIKALIYEVDTSNASGGVSLLASSEDYTITSMDRGQWVDIPITDAFLNPVTLFNGYAYKLGVAGYQSSTDSSFVGTSGEAMYNGENNVFDVFGLNPNLDAGVIPGDPTWYYTTRTPMVRMNFDPASVVTPASVEDLKSNISIYPNPTSGIFTIELDIITDYDVRVYNVLGQKVYTNLAASMSTEIDLSNLDNGIYNLEIEINNIIYNEKVIVE